MLKHIMRAASLAALIAAGPLAIAPAYAHAELLDTVPVADSTVTAPLPTELRIHFSEAIELAFTKATVTGPDGAVVETGPLALDPADNTIVIVPLVGPLPSGLITIDWTAVSTDSHKSNGLFHLTVAQ